MSSYLFRYGFSQNKQMRYVISIKGGVDIEMPMGNMNNPINMEMRISQKIVSFDAEQAIIRVVIDRVTADRNIPADSLPKTGVESVMQMDRLGTVRWVDGAAAWQGAEHSMMRFPEQALEVGDSWVQQVEDSSGAATTFHTRYSFAGVDEDNANLMIFSTELFSGHPDNPASGLVGKGVFSYDDEEKWIHGCSNHIEYRYRMPMPDNSGAFFTTTTVMQIEMERLA
ncbi:MAG: hypothetical protein CVV41_06610 [Candidatus Riflebacteria bacterium HGW-Riflebacteria-1]|jgi:hypothetical protein|nr:MAG: hypothetical protein CVV41_06610 [Candidatus Riflebacteria bacterium HGW-Riflebacteria-1]